MTCLVMPWLCPTAYAQGHAPKTVLTVHWSSEDVPNSSIVDGAIREVLLTHADAPVDYFAEHLESDRFPEEEASVALRDYIRQKYRGRTFDLVFAVSDVALKFVLRYRDELFPQSPIVYSATLSPPNAARYGTRLTGVISEHVYNKTLDLALALHPATERVFVIAQAPAGQLLDQVRRELSAFEQRVRLTYFTEMPVSRLVAAVKAVPPRSVILFIRDSQEEPGQVLFPPDVARLVAQASPVPVYGSSETYLGTGIVGGAVYPAHALGTRLGEIGRQILAGKAPVSPIEIATTVPIFDWRQVSHWKIGQSTLPSGSDIRFREPNAWDRYRWYLLGAIVLAALQTLMIAALIIERSRRRQAQTRYALATAAGGVGVWDWNVETNEFHVDASVKASLGYAVDELGNHFNELFRVIHPDDAAAVMARARALVEGAPSYEMEFRALHRDGSTRWFLSRGSHVRRNGRSAHVTGTYIDITERKMSERALGEMQTELTRVSRLTALGEFAASLSHEVRQPLTAIIMNAKTCLRWLGDAAPNLPEIKAALLDVVDAGKRANELIQRNRELFKQRTVQKEPLDIHDVIHDVAVLAATRLQVSRVTLTTSLTPDLPTVVGDRIELQQVLLNLIVNSIEATDGVDPGLRRIDVSTALTSAGLVRVSVSDNGIGLDGVDVRRMFSLSYTTKANGTGIGLSLSRAIVEAHGGRLWAEPNPGAGATFSFTVPVCAVVADTATSAARPGMSDEQGRRQLSGF